MATHLISTRCYMLIDYHKEIMSVNVEVQLSFSIGQNFCDFSDINSLIRYSLSYALDRIQVQIQSTPNNFIFQTQKQDKFPDFSFR